MVILRFRYKKFFFSPGVKRLSAPIEHLETRGQSQFLWNNGNN